MQYMTPWWRKTMIPLLAWAIWIYYIMAKTPDTWRQISLFYLFLSLATVTSCVLFIPLPISFLVTSTLILILILLQLHLLTTLMVTSVSIFFSLGYILIRIYRPVHTHTKKEHPPSLDTPLIHHQHDVIHETHKDDSTHHAQDERSDHSHIDKESKKRKPLVHPFSFPEKM